MRVGVVRVPSVFLMENDLESPADQIFMGWAVGILGEKGEFYQVLTHYGYPGYVKKDAVKITLEEKLRQRDRCGSLAMVAAPFADVLAEPRVQGERLLTLEKGSYVERVGNPHKPGAAGNGRQKGFSSVRTASGVTGFVPDIALMRRPDNDGYLGPGRKPGYFLGQAVPEREFREKVVLFASSYLNTPYRWGGKSQRGIDCSGLTFMCYLFGGVIIYRDAKIHPGYPVKSISFDKLEKGDLLYFPGHIGIYIGEGRYIHATGNENSFACVIGSFLEEDRFYREDLRKSLYAVGSIF